MRYPLDENTQHYLITVTANTALYECVKLASQVLASHSQFTVLNFIPSQNSQKNPSISHFSEFFIVNN